MSKPVKEVPVVWTPPLSPDEIAQKKAQEVAAEKFGETATGLIILSLAAFTVGALVVWASTEASYQTHSTVIPMLILCIGSAIDLSTVAIFSYFLLRSKTN